MIRRLESKDSSAYYKLRLRGLQLHPEAFGTGAEDWSKATDEQVKSLLGQSSQDDFVLGHFEDDELMGVIGLKREKKNSVQHKATVWGLMVLPEFQRQGIGRKLLRELVHRASENLELQFIRAIVTDASENASVLFESQGFEKYGLESRGIRKDNQFFDQIYLALNLREKKYLT